METKLTRSFIKVAAAIPQVKVADCIFNMSRIKALIADAEKKKVDIVVFPELCITGYTCGDLFLQDTLINQTKETLFELLDETSDMEVCFIVGAPIKHNSKLYNCAVVCQKGEVLGVVPKEFLPNYSEFYEKRWFKSYDRFGPVPAQWKEGSELVPFGNDILFDMGNMTFAVEICEDLWSVVPPSSYHVRMGAQLIFNLSASTELIGKQQYVKSLISQQSARCQAGYVYAAAGFGESTTDVVYAGNAYIYEDGRLLAESERFQLKEQLIISEIDIELLDSERRKNTTFFAKIETEDYERAKLSLSPNDPELTRVVNPTPFIPQADNYDESCEEIFSIQVLGLAKRVMHINAQALILGISGGLDSTLALLVCVKMADKLGLDRKMIHGITMPGFGTTDRTYTNALNLMKSLGITLREIDIKAACEQHFKDIGHDPSVHDVVFENTQARERTQILMDLANQLNGLVIGTGDMSELALGWATYNGDHMSMYSVNSGIPKTLVRHLVKWVADTQMDKASAKTLLDIVDTPVSPELLPTTASGGMTQFTEDVVGPYELHDFFLYYMLRYGFTPTKIYLLAKHAFKGKYNNNTILRWMEVFYRRFFNHQFKRSCMPDGPKVGSVNLSPRGDWRMPSDASSAIWLNEIETLKTSK
jgi:NAD+ synthetase